MSLTAEQVIDLLRLEPLPIEGGYYRVTYRAEETLDAATLPARYGAPRAYGGAIYYLLHGVSFSALHRLLTDEIYHFYLGQAVEMLLLYPDRHDEFVRLGADLAAGERVQVVAPRGVWQGSRLVGHARANDFALMGTTMAPAYDQADFELGDRETLIAAYPQRADLIRALTREEEGAP
jgi:predicted cupin superfamily sugar epimerase